MTIEEFKKHCFHTRTRVVIPALRTYIDKSTMFKRGKYSPDKVDKTLTELYESNKEKLERI